MLTFQIWPLAVDRTEVVCEWHFHPDEMAKPGFDPKGAVEFWDLTNQQDWELSDLAQQGISTAGLPPGALLEPRGAARSASTASCSSGSRRSESLGGPRGAPARARQRPAGRRLPRSGRPSASGRRTEGRRPRRRTRSRWAARSPRSPWRRRTRSGRTSVTSDPNSASRAPLAHQLADAILVLLLDAHQLLAAVGERHRVAPLPREADHRLDRAVAAAHHQDLLALVGSPRRRAGT